MSIPCVSGISLGTNNMARYANVQASIATANAWACPKGFSSTGTEGSRVSATIGQVSQTEYFC